MCYYIPENLDLDLFIKNYPPTSIANFCKTKLLYILDLITTIPVYNKGLLLVNDFVPLNAQLLQRKVRNYKQYLDYLITQNIVEVNKQYIPGVKSKSYKFSEQYSTPVVGVSKRNHQNHGAIIRKPKIMLSKKQKVDYKHLIKWYNESFQIDLALANQYILNEYKLKIEKRDSGFDKSPLLQYNSSKVSIEKFSAGALHLNIDDFGYRLHSNLTNLNSILRNLLTYNGLQLISIDISNSQPYMSTLLFNSSFWELPSQTDVLTHNSIGLSTTNIFNKYSTCLFIMLCKKANSNEKSDLHKYLEIVQKGIFYEYMATQSNIDIDNRKQVKAAMFQVLFTDNHFINQKEAAPKRIFKELFPDVYKLFSLLKQKEKNNMPMLLQRIESHVILLTITKRIAKEQPNLPIFTIHDSIVTTKGNEVYIQNVMKEEMTKIFGFPPQLTVSLWKPENILFRENTGDNQIQIAA